MRVIPKLFVPALLLAAAAPICLAAAPQDPVVLAQKQITAYLTQLADLHCTEAVTQEKLDGNSHVELSERSQFDYLIMMNGDADNFQLNETRVETPGNRHKLISKPMLITNGVPTLLLVFHPYYRDGFTFETRPEELISGRRTIPIHFAHIQGHRTPVALALRGREYPLDLEGTAWLDESSQQVVRMEAALQHDMVDVGLRSLSIHVDYMPTVLAGQNVPVNLPSVAIVEVTTPRQHWRNTHAFNRYRGFSTDVEQDPNVKIHPDTTAANGEKPSEPGQQGAPTQP
jgi:hypothetical protein